jgi:hypothetical protein
MTKTNKSSSDGLWNEIDNCVERSDQSGDDTELRSLAERLCYKASTGVQELWYPAGYAYYCLKSRISDDSVQLACESCLRNAIASNSDVDLAKAYLAFHNYDLGRYDNAIEFEANINYNRLEESVQLRYREICLCARIRIQGLTDSVSQIVKFANFVEGLSSPDPMPFLLKRCLASFPESAFEPGNIMDAMFALDRAYAFMGPRYFSNGT